MGRVVGLAAAVVSMLVLAGQGGAATGGVIVFTGTPEGSTMTQLFSIHASGDGLTQLTKGSYPAINPAFSPSGKRIAFTRFGVGLFTMNADGTGLRRLTKNGRDAYPTWSPNGRAIAFVRPIRSAWRVFTVPAAGGRQTWLKQAPPAGRPSWTRAGLLVATAGDLLRVDTRTGRVLKYYDANLDAIWGLNTVTLSPAVSKLTYVGTRAPIPGDMECGDGPCQRFGLYLESLTGKKKPQLIVKDAGAATFSPDGRRLAFVAGGALVVRAVASSQSAPITTTGVTPISQGPPTWR